MPLRLHATTDWFHRLVLDRLHSRTRFAPEDHVAHWVQCGDACCSEWLFLKRINSLPGNSSQRSSWFERQTEFARILVPTADVWSQKTRFSDTRPSRGRISLLSIAGPGFSPFAEPEVRKSWHRGHLNVSLKCLNPPNRARSPEPNGPWPVELRSQRCCTRPGQDVQSVTTLSKTSLTDRWMLSKGV